MLPRMVPGLVCILFGLVSIAGAIVGCCSPADCETPKIQALVKVESTEPPTVAAAVLDELASKHAALQVDCNTLTLELSRQADAHAAMVAELSQRIADDDRRHNEAEQTTLERVRDLERVAADVPPHLPLALAKDEPAPTLEPIPKPAHLVEPVAIVAKPAAPKEFAGVEIIANTTAQCPPCERFKKTDGPELEKLGASVSVVPGTGDAGGYPWFEVRVNSSVSCRRLPIHRGRLDANTLRRLLKPQ